MDKMERVVRHLVKSYARSVRRCEIEDLYQTVWYLVLLSVKSYDPSQSKSIESYAYYFADMKLRDHFWRRVKLPETDGSFSLLQIKANMMEDMENLPDMAESENLPYPVSDVVELKSQGYTSYEIEKILKISHRKFENTIREFKNSMAP